MTELTAILGGIGTFLILIAYVPQIRHIYKEHCTGGVSVRAWLVWLIGTILIFTYAIDLGDSIFITIQTVNLIAVVTILLLIKFYAKRVCHSKEHIFKDMKKKLKKLKNK